jgi:ATP-dependent DNA ligase
MSSIVGKRSRSSSSVRQPEGANPSQMPGFIKPQLATLKATAPSGDQWLHEIKYDGYRVQIHINAGNKKVFTRNGLDWTKRFSAIAGALDISGQAIFDDEVVVIHDAHQLFRASSRTRCRQTGQVVVLRLRPPLAWS